MRKAILILSLAAAPLSVSAEVVPVSIIQGEGYRIEYAIDTDTLGLFGNAKTGTLSFDILAVVEMFGRPNEIWDARFRVDCASGGLLSIEVLGVKDAEGGGERAIGDEKYDFIMPVFDGWRDTTPQRVANIRGLCTAALQKRESQGSKSTDPEPPSSPHSPPAAGGGLIGTGTGFYVTPDGIVLTNAHVVDGCSNISVNGSIATIVAEDEGFDLAILEGDAALTPVPYLPFASSPARLNADITIAGYPLHGLLGGLNITRGEISSLQGLGGDAVTMQISAPVQPGNSGGPVVNDYGEVVGIVVSKLDTLTVADAIGDIPQNVNFAIRASIAEVLFSANGLTVNKRTSEVRLPPEELAERLQDTTVLIECR